MIIQNLLLSNESYTHDNWLYRDVTVGFSRLYYILAGTAYYEEKGKARQLRPGYLYLTPVKKPFTLYEDANNKLLHTHAHIVTLPAVDSFTEIEVRPDTPLADAVALWRKYATCQNSELLTNILSFLLSCMEKECAQQNTVAKQAKDHIDAQADFSLTMQQLSEVLGYSREHITRCFLTAYGTTPKQYYHLRRMRVAVEQLIAGKSVGAIAEYLRYASPYAFSKAFKQHFGLSPQQYLRTLKNQKSG